MNCQFESLWYDPAGIPPYPPSIIIPPDAMTVLNSYFACDLDPNSNVILESEMSSQETALCSSNHLDHSTSSANQFSQSIQNITISGQPSPILCTPNQSTTNSDDLGHLHSSDTNISQNLGMYKQVSPISDMGSCDSISSVNSESGNEERDQNNTSNGGQVLLTDSDYTSDSSNNCVSKTNMKVCIVIDIV
ncbi:unnamed protein product [Mytilus coruscus]|uniref:Uncharacterized protein n=1 Tax=Mytilus coruscus TaxID=42192 RepID=A0A6J7ZW09_MYTCO|nr:unnamed protein product [Mytilus coruscus]